MDNKINLELFVTCRLCIETKGQYQIVPEVQDQIKHCFDIQVQTFDGLSQVICRKCKDDLLRYLTLRNKFQENQQTLLELKAKKAQDDEKNENTDADNCISSDDSLPISTSASRKKTYKRIIPSDSDASDSPPPRKQLNTNELQKVFACRFCSRECDSLKTIKRHYRTHGNLLGVLQKFTNVYCDVRLSKCDYELCDDSDDTVVKLNSSDIIGIEANKYYYVKYISKEKKVGEKLEKQKAKVKRKQEDDHFNAPRYNNKKTRRTSNSSVGTVVAEDFQPNEAPKSSKASQASSTSEVNCVELGDSSSDSGVASTLKQTSKADVLATALKHIHSINNSCYNNYVNREKQQQNKATGPVSDILDKKLLSIGTKVMSTKGCVSLGLLKYLEHKNLSVQWIPQQSKDKNYVRILTKKKSQESHESILDGWNALVGCLQTNGTKSPPIDLQREDTTPTTHTRPDKDSAVLTAISTNSSLGNKLLNASPVTNPKKLPKKPVLQDTKPVALPTKTEKMDANAKNNIDPIVIDSDEDTRPDENGNESMPVITSVLSLAPPEPSDSKESQDEDATLMPIPAETQNHVPRIKCKPVSELMARSSSPTNKPANNSLPPQNADSSVTLNTVDIPNKKTNNPTQYFKTLLSMHSLVLHTNINFNLLNYHALIKYQFVITIENTQFSFGIALYVWEKDFYLEIINVTNDNVKLDIAELPAHWQMLVLKSFIGDVSVKIEKNAVTLSKRINDNVRRFLCLLKSIEEVGLFI